MGYHVSMEISDLIIPAEKIAECLAAINELHTEDNLQNNGRGGNSDGKKWYSWVDNPKDADGFKDMKEAITSWRYSGDFDDAGNFMIEYFDGEKWGGDEDCLYRAIAPFVNDGGTIECLGEEGERWRYLFAEGKMTEQTGRTVWE